MIRDIEPPRTLLFVPADRAEELLPKALLSRPDAVVLDLEDAVTGEAKDRARATITRALDAAARGYTALESPIFVRTQAVGALGFDQDVAAAVDGGVSGLVLPKISSATDVHVARDAIRSAPTPTELLLIPLLETPEGILSAREVARADDAVIGLGLGGEDLRASLGAPRSVDGRELAYARGAIVLAAKAEGRWVFDTVSIEIDDPAIVEEEARTARGLGFTGKFVIHPAQVAAVHRGFCPTRLEVEQAERVIAAFSQAAEAGQGVASVDGRMIDAPVVVAAREILDQWRRGMQPDGHA